MGADGAFHVLDDADAKGYIKPRPTADGRRKTSHRKPFSRAEPGATRGQTQDSNNQNDKAGHSDDDVAAAGGGHRGRGHESSRSTTRRTQLVHEARRSEGRESNAAGRVSSGGAGAGAGAALEISLASRGSAALGGKKNTDGGRSVLLRRVAFAYDSDDNDTDNDNGGGQSTAGGARNPAIRVDERDSEVPLSGANNVDPNGDDDDLPAEVRDGSTESATPPTMSR